MKVVIALGGNAISKKGEGNDFGKQEKRVKKAMSGIYDLVKGNRVVITHGNGPAVGQLLLKQPGVDLDILDAETEGQIGYLIQQNLKNLFLSREKKREVVSLLTQVLVDSKDEGFRKPTKFVGPFYSKAEALRLKRKFVVREDSGRGWRRVVPSPSPIEIVEAGVIRNLMEKGNVVIAAGGGGIPVIRKGKKLDGVSAVVDKDLASACLANSLKANMLVILTSVDGVYLNFGAKNAERLGQLSLSELQAYYNGGVFTAGSMGPKVLAAIRFLEGGRGRKVIITDVKNLKKALSDKAGTVVVN